MISLRIRQENITGLQIGVQIACPAAHSKGGAHVQTQIDSGQMGQRLSAHHFGQRAFVMADQIYVIAHALVHLLNLVTHVRRKAFQLAETIQNICFPDNTVRQLLEVSKRFCGIGVCTGQQQSIQLHL